MKFEVKSGNVIITDPCYTKSPSCMIPKHPAKNGTWHGCVKLEDSEGRVAKLIAWHSDYCEDDADSQYIGDICVDSGQAGIFDEATYPEGETTGELGSLDSAKLNRKLISFYDECCVHTCGEDASGSVKHFGSGAVSSSGYGDGGYDVRGRLIDGKLVAVMIDFIPEIERCDWCGENIDNCVCYVCDDCGMQESECECDGDDE